MCWRLGCLFRDVDPPTQGSGQDGSITLLVIGASGMTGSALLDAAVACVWFKVIAFTRDQDNLADNKHVKTGHVCVVEGDMLEVRSLYRAMRDVDAVFFTTAYWDTRDAEVEYKQGANVVEVAARAHLKHLLYVGTPYSLRQAEEECRYLTGRERVQQLVCSCGVPYTIIHLGFYYENLMSVFKPHLVEPLTYAVALPMGNVAINCGSVLDLAHCIAKIILQPTSHFGTTVKLATGYYTVTQLSAWLDRQFPDLTFYDPKISMEEYRAMMIDELEELPAFFLFLQSDPHAGKWDQRPAYQLCPLARTFKDWLGENEKVFLTCLNEDQWGEGSAMDQMKNLDVTSLPSSASFWQPSQENLTGQKKRLNTKTAFRIKEEDMNFERRAALCDEVKARSGFAALWQLFLDSDG